jgi:SAM-dependent methyltransferase
MVAISTTPSPSPASDRSKVAWSCVVDDTPQIWSSITPWLATAIELAGIDPARIHVHHACDLRPEIAELCASLGVNTIAVAPFDARSPHCNKIRQCESDFADADRVVLTVVDIAFASRPPLEQIKGAVAGKLVDCPNPPIEILDRIFVEAGMSRPRACSNVCWRSQQGWASFDSLPGNFNGGLYVVDAVRIPALGARWAYWARWLLDRLPLLGQWRVHVDQVSFCLALAESGLETDVLSDAWNFPVHLPTPPGGEDEPIVLHHHGRLDAHMRLLPVAEPRARPAIERVNRAIERFQRRNFDNRSFWNHRYAHHPELGSGLGSRGDVLQLKQDLLADLMPAHVGLSVLDWGCGDLEVVRSFPWRDYVGVDISTEALRMAKEKRPDWLFATPAAFDAIDGQCRDVVLCLDVLIHQPTHAEYSALVRKLVALARRGVLVAGFDRDPGIRSHITYFHEPLGETLAALPGVSAVVPLVEYRDTTLFFVAIGADGADAAQDMLSVAAQADPASCVRRLLAA